MKPALAFIFLLGFISVLVFISWLIATRRSRRHAELARLKAEVLDYERLLFDIRVICNNSRDIDPSAELILMTIRDYNKDNTKEIK
jgi:hypothetical protein